MTGTVHFHDLPVTFIIKCFAPPVNLTSPLPVSFLAQKQEKRRFPVPASIKAGMGLRRSSQDGLLSK